MSSLNKYLRIASLAARILIAILEGLKRFGNHQKRHDGGKQGRKNAKGQGPPQEEAPGSPPLDKK